MRKKPQPVDPALIAAFAAKKGVTQLPPGEAGRRTFSGKIVSKEDLAMADPAITGVHLIVTIEGEKGQTTRLGLKERLWWNAMDVGSTWKFFSLTAKNISSRCDFYIEEQPTIIEPAPGKPADPFEEGRQGPRYAPDF